MLAGLEWVRTLLFDVQQRQAVGEPWLRMALILGSVALFTLLAAWCARGRAAPGGNDAPGARADSEARGR